MNFILKINSTFEEVDMSVIESIENKIKDNIPIDEDESEIILDYICFKTKQLISENVNIDTFDNKDILATSIINNYFNELGVITHVCNTRLNIDKNVKNNTFLIVELFETIVDHSAHVPHIVDATYRQFFTKEKCYCNYDNKKAKKPDPGYYIHPYDREEIIYFLEHGHDYFGHAFAGVYGDSFLNTLPSIEKNFISKNSSEYYNCFMKGSNIKLISPDELEKNGTIIHPIKSQIKKM